MTGSSDTKECPKCGAVLPLGEEVLCQNCGTAFGGKTTVMAAVSTDRPLPKRAGSSPTGGASAAAPAPPKASKFPLLVLVILGVVAIACVAVLVILMTGS